MWFSISFAACLVYFAVATLASEKRAFPTVDIEYATVVGSSHLGIDSFRGIPYAQPPVGNLRLKPPRPITANLGTVIATGIEGSCPQMPIGDNNTGSYFEDVIGKLLNDPYFQTAIGSSEDCLTVNVQRPSSVNANSKLPVVFWIFGGGFQFGSTQTYDASELISTSMAQGKDIIYVSVNYRLSGFGFLPGAEVLKDGSANLGLLDQRLCLQWVADNIAQFGGDPEKVTLWGQSAGAVSAFDQMILYKGSNTYKGKPLFRAGILDSGSIVPGDPVDCPKGQAVYDQVVSAPGCSGSPDTLECLRSLDYTTYLGAVNSVPFAFSYNSVALSYIPRPDGVILADSPDVLVSNGQYVRVPLIMGDQEDEGTMFSLFQSNIITTDLLVSYLSEIFFHDIPVDQLQELVALYPDDPTAGSPYNTGYRNEIYPQYKRLASILGDVTFTMSRRVFLTVATLQYPAIPSRSYLSSYGGPVPILGTFQGSDLLTAYGIVSGFPTSSVQAYYLSFINTLDPNKGTVGEIKWPQWIAGRQLLNFRRLTNVLVPDNFRSEIFDFLFAHVSVLHI